MYEYKVLELSVRKCETTLNQFAKDGWELVTMSPNISRGMGVIVTMRKNIEK